MKNTNKKDIKQIKKKQKQKKMFSTSLITINAGETLTNNVVQEGRSESWAIATCYIISKISLTNRLKKSSANSKRKKGSRSKRETVVAKKESRLLHIQLQRELTPNPHVYAML